MTPDGAKPIEQFQPGDLVLSAPEDDPEAPVVARRVEEVFQRGIGHIIELRVGGQLIRTTHEHLFYVDSKALGKQWLAACALCPGDLLRSHDGRWVAVDSVSDTDEDVTVYNLRVEEYHTYFVGDIHWGFSVWAHNANCGTPVVKAPVEAGTLSAAERAEIQAIANKYNTTIDVVGSRAAGQGRNVGSKLPVGKGPGTKSDIDFRIDTSHSQASELISDLQEVGNGAGSAGTKWGTNQRPTYPPYIRISPEQQLPLSLR